jgi:XTP/dITP diphosphohydrolase
MEGISDRRARFMTGIAYADAQTVQVFTGVLEGRIATKPRGNNGFGYDPIFEIGEKTLAELSIEEKGLISHRGQALSRFRDWFVAQMGKNR